MSQLSLGGPVVATDPVVIGLDLSLTGAGYAGPDGTKLFTSTGHKGDTLNQRAVRIAGLRDEILEALDGWQADLVVIEQPSFASTGGSAHDRSGLWWFVVDRLIAAGIPVVEVPPSTLKKYVAGNGQAKKNSICGHIVKRFDVLIEDDNEADAFALRALGLDLLGHPLVQMPAFNRSALEKLPRPVIRGAA
jgi:crossover junction endodeoxyribonuclease RuvC